MVKHDQKGKNNPNWKGGVSISYYRRLALEKLLQVCVNCETTENLVVHHKDGNTKNNILENLEMRCYTCHNFGKNAIHPHPRNRKGIKWSQEMKDVISERTREALSKPEIRKRMMERPKRFGKDNSNYKHGRYSDARH